jgi:hypothetical protein
MSTVFYGPMVPLEGVSPKTNIYNFLRQDEKYLTWHDKQGIVDEAHDGKDNVKTTG